MLDPTRRVATCAPAIFAVVLLVSRFSTPLEAQTPGANPAPAASAISQSEKNGNEFYLSWGYNTESYRSVELYISQPELANDSLHAVDFHERKGWSTGLLSHSVTGPQYNFQFCFFFRRNTALEMNFVHAKAIVTQDQTVKMTGSLAGQPVEGNVLLTEDVLVYELNNGANLALFNVVQRFPLLRKPGQTGSISVLGKAGIGFVAPHTENTVFGIPNENGFQFSGPDLGLELAIRLHVFRAFYTEFCEKGVYRPLPGTQHQSGSCGTGVVGAY